jgi:hypothetical protein
MFPIHIQIKGPDVASTLMGAAAAVLAAYLAAV